MVRTLLVTLSKAKQILTDALANQISSLMDAVFSLVVERRRRQEAPIRKWNGRYLTWPLRRNPNAANDLNSASFTSNPQTLAARKIRQHHRLQSQTPTPLDLQSTCGLYKPSLFLVDQLNSYVACNHRYLQRGQVSQTRSRPYPFRVLSVLQLSSRRA